jgi:hypothetical protein
MGLVRYATKYGGITQPEVCAVLKVSTVKTNAALADLARREKVRPLPGGAWVALPPKPARARRPSVEVPRGDPHTVPPPTGRLEVPEGVRYPDSFYVDVARTYEALLLAGVPPNTAISAANSVPKTTADRWVRVARRKGFLAPAPRGYPSWR